MCQATLKTFFLHIECLEKTVFKFQSPTLFSPSYLQWGVALAHSDRLLHK